MVKELFKNLHLQLSADDIKRIDAWKTAHGMKSRTEAIRAIIRTVISNNSNEDISDIKKNFLSENNDSRFLRPENSNKDRQKNESIEELVRKVVKEELSKL